MSHQRTPRLAAVVVTLTAAFVLSACSADQPPPSCVATARFNGAEYRGLQIIDSDPSVEPLTDQYGPSIGESVSVPCDDRVEAEHQTAYRIPQVEPEEAVLLVAGESELYLRAALVDQPGKWSAGLTDFIGSHPAVSNM